MNRRSTHMFVAAAGAAAALAMGAGGQTTWYVDDDNCPNQGSGTQFDPFCSIQDAIDAAGTHDEVVVAPGTYYETIDLLGKAITVRGSSGMLPSTIDGQGAGSVVTIDSGEGPDTVFEGFTITGGIGTNVYDTYLGCGMFISGSSPTIKRCVFWGNVAPSIYSLGGGMYVEGDGGNAEPTVIGCVFAGNAVNSGGGMYIDGFFGDATVRLVNCLLVENSATLGGAGAGGGIYAFQASAVVTGCTISGNASNWQGGGISGDGSSLFVRNSIVWGNGGSAEIFNDGSTPNVRYSDVQGGFTGPGNIIADPLFVDPFSGDYRLHPDSPCIDAGHNWYVPADTQDLDDDGDTVECTPYDLDGQPRFTDVASKTDTGCGEPVVVDMGAYERAGAAAHPVIPADLDGDGQVNINDLLDLLAAWGPVSGCTLADLNMDNTVDIQDLLAALAAWGTHP